MITFVVGSRLVARVSDLSQYVQNYVGQQIRIVSNFVRLNLKLLSITVAVEYFRNNN